MTIHYRPATAADVPALAQLGRETFVQTFAHLYDPADLHSFLDQVYSPAAVQSDFDNPAMHFRLAQEGDGTLVGFCKIMRGVSLDYDPGDKQLIELKQLYVLEPWQGRGVAHSLIQWAISRAEEMAADEMLLSVYCENIRAQRFYRRYGFFHIGDTIFMVGKHADHEFLFLKDMRL